MKSTLFLVADAIRSDYLNETDAPFLTSLISSSVYVKFLRPNFGFCERSEMFSGTRPDKNGYFTAITLDEARSPFGNVKKDIVFFQLFDWKVFLRLYTRRFFRDYFGKIRHIKYPIYEIPLRLLPRIALTEDERDLHGQRGLDVETIFDVLRKEKKTSYFDAFVSLTLPAYWDDDRMKIALKGFENQYDFYPAYVGEGDFIGHEYGPCSRERREMVRRVDQRIQTIVTRFKESYPEGNVLIIGDHGMVDTQKYIDIERRFNEIEKKYPLRAFRDFSYFLDSTLVRVWFHSPEAEKTIRRRFAEDKELMSEGEVLTKEKCESLHVPPPGGRYGDFYWRAKPGVVIFPDFFHRRQKVKGMHGYETHIPEQKGFAIIQSPSAPHREIQEAELIDICPTLCKMLDISIPRDNSGTSLL